MTTTARRRGGLPGDAIAFVPATAASIRRPAPMFPPCQHGDPTKRSTTSHPEGPRRKQVPATSQPQGRSGCLTSPSPPGRSGGPWVPLRASPPAPGCGAELSACVADLQHNLWLVTVSLPHARSLTTTRARPGGLSPPEATRVCLLPFAAPAALLLHRRRPGALSPPTSLPLGLTLARSVTAACRRSNTAATWRSIAA